jgi:hypothetical protein
MRKRKLLVTLAGLAVVIAVAVVVPWPFKQDRLAVENLNRV